MRPAFRPDIQGLRAVAVLLVVAYHLWPDGLTGGFVGVDVFFVISGFLITAHLPPAPARPGRDLLEFWGRRIRRLLPAAFVVLAAVVASRVSPRRRAGRPMPARSSPPPCTCRTGCWPQLASTTSPRPKPPTPVQHYWSLAVEEQFYLVWPILILAAYWSRDGRASAAAYRGAGDAVGRRHLAGVLILGPTRPASAYFITPTRVWELALGGCIAALPALGAGPLGRGRDGVASLGLAMILLAGVTITAATPFPGTQRSSRSPARPW